MPNNAATAGLLDATRQFLLTYAQLGDLVATRRTLVEGGLPQRSRATRETASKSIESRLACWHPPDWVWEDITTFARDEYQPSLQASLLLHVVRQDTLLYDFVQMVIVPRWYDGEKILVRADVQHFLDSAQATHPEIDGWSHETREKLAGNVLTILRDYGLLRGSGRGNPRKGIVEPIVPQPVACHLVRLLLAEGIERVEVPRHPDWRIWLWNEGRAQAACHSISTEEDSA